MTILHLMTSNSFFLFNFSFSHERLCYETSHHFNDLRSTVNFKFQFRCDELESIPADHIGIVLILLVSRICNHKYYNAL